MVIQIQKLKKNIYICVLYEILSLHVLYVWFVHYCWISLKCALIFIVYIPISNQ